MLTAKQRLKECGRIIRIGTPITFAMLLHMSMGFVDTVMTGNYNAEALAAVSMGHYFITPFLFFGSGVIEAGQVITAHYVGSDLEKPEIGKVTIHAIIIGAIYSIFLILLTKIAPLLLPYFGFKAPVILLATDYLFAFSWGLPAMIIFRAFAGFYAGISKPLATMYFALFMLGINIIGNYTLIFGHFGFPELGAEGAGWTSSLAAWSGVLGILLYSVFHKEIKQFNPFKSNFRLDRILSLQILKIGIPSGFSIVFELSMFSVFSLLMGRFGIHVLAGSQIALNCTNFIFMVPAGLSFAITTNVGLYLGQQKYQEARNVGFSGYFVNVFFSLCSAIGLIFFSKNIASFYTVDLELVEIASGLLIFAGIFQLSDGIQVAGMGILRGYKDTKIPMICNLISYWGIGMPLGYVLGFIFNYKAEGMWVGIITGLTVAAILHGLRFRNVSRRYIKSSTVGRYTDITSDGGDIEICRQLRLRQPSY